MEAVDRMMRYGSRLAWFVGSLSTLNMAGFGDMRVSLPLVIVIVTHPNQPLFLHPGQISLQLG